MPAPYPQDFREDVVRVARSRDDGVTIAQIVKDFGVHEMTLHEWFLQADIGNRPGKTREDSAEIRELRRRKPAPRAGERGPSPCCRLPLAGEHARKRLYPLVKEFAGDGIPVVVSLRVVKLSQARYYRWLTQQVTDAELIEAHRANVLLDAHRGDPEYGYRLLVGEAAEAGEVMCERTGWKICRDNQWWSSFGKKRAKNESVQNPRSMTNSCSGTSRPTTSMNSG